MNSKIGRQLLISCAKLQMAVRMLVLGCRSEEEGDEKLIRNHKRARRFLSRWDQRAVALRQPKTRAVEVVEYFIERNEAG